MEWLEEKGIREAKSFAWKEANAKGLLRVLALRKRQDWNREIERLRWGRGGS